MEDDTLHVDLLTAPPTNNQKQTRIDQSKPSDIFYTTVSALSSREQ
jgi:hypothetical protein